MQNGSADQDGPDAPSVDPADEPVLRAKYLDYCSARLSEVFLSLSEERIYDLVEEAAVQGRLNMAELAFDEMVKLVTEKLRHSVPLPDFESWVRQYREEPERFDQYLMGLWEERVEGEPSTGGGEEEREEDGP